MFCSTCGAGDQSPNAYCKRCGQWLADQKPRRTPEEKMKAMLVLGGLSAMFALFSAIILFASIGTPHAKTAMLLAGAFCSVIAVRQTILVILAIQFKQRFKRGGGDSKRTIELETGSSVTALGSDETTEFINARSVTENTTELLDAVLRVREPSDSQ